MANKIPELLRKADGSPITTREEWERERPRIRETMCREEYGFLPPPPDSVTAKTEDYPAFVLAGKAAAQAIDLKIQVGDRSFTLPVKGIVPKTDKPPMAFLFLSFGADNYFTSLVPMEEIIDRGFAVFVVNYGDLSTDDDDFSNGVCALFPNLDRQNDSTACGKLGLWAWTLSRVMDYLQTREDIDRNNIAVVGHSRLGKTALLAAAMDERFAFAVPVNSGAGGAAIFHGKVGEHIEHSIGNTHFWYCGNFRGYVGKDNELPFDQHFLLGLIAPRKLYVCSAQADQWADPAAELLGCRLVSPVYELYGEKGFEGPEGDPELNRAYHGGSVGYHVRPGEHYFGRFDWLQIMDFMDRHRNS